MKLNMSGLLHLQHHYSNIHKLSFVLVVHNSDMQLLLYIHLPAATKDNSPWTTGITHHFSPYIPGTRHSPQGSIKEKVAVEYGYIITYVLLTVLSSLLEKWDWDWGPSSLVKCCFNWMRITYRFQSRVRYNVFACMTIDWDTKKDREGTCIMLKVACALQIS